ncbi:hypothetical protein F4803DRAFT_329307 [Xylaria telfairii]|nr:hypothetical protein F4803DRAFT_329307 [Xylaria telfairii]
MEPPSKRLRLDPSPYGVDDDDENQDELSMTPAQFNASQDPMYQLDKGRAKAATRLKSTLEDIFEKYGKDFDGDDDVINFYTDEIEVDNGHVLSLESRNDAATEDSLSADEEERIISGKSSGRRKRQKSQPKSQPKSLIPASHPKNKPNSRSQFNSPWNDPPGLGTYRLSSLAFSCPPYDALPLFDFGPSPSRDGPIDPVWQAPDLPVQPRRQHTSFIGAAGGRFSPFSTRPHHVAKRLVTAKSFLLHTTSSSSMASNGAVEEEDDILLGGSKRDQLPITHSRSPGKTGMLVASSASSSPSSQSPGQQPPFYGIGLDGDLRKESIQDRAVEPSMRDTSSASCPPAEENARPYQIAASSHSPSPSRIKKGRPKKSDTRKPTTSHNEELNTGHRPLQANERRIEIIIPMMKHLFPAEIDRELVIKETTPAVGEIPKEPHMEQSVLIDENKEIPHSQNSLHTTPPIGSHEDLTLHQPSPESAEGPRDADVEHPIQTSESSKDAHKPSSSPDSRTRRPKRTKKQTELLIAHTSQHDEQDLQNISNKTSQGSFEIETDASTDDYITNGLCQIEQKPNRDCENDGMPLGSQRSPIIDIGIDEHAAYSMSIEQSAERTLIKQHDPKAPSFRLPSPAETSYEGPTDCMIQVSGSATTEAIVFETAILQELETSHCNDERIPLNEHPAPVDSHGEEELSIPRYAPDNELPHHDLQFGELLSISEVLIPHEARTSTPDQDIRSHSPGHWPTCETTEPHPHSSEDSLPRTFGPPGTCEDQESGASGRPLLSSILLAQIDGLQLDSDPPDTERSPSPQAIELPDQDLSAFPVEDDAHSTSKLVVRLSSRKTQTDAQYNTGIGRSPSPELGTPIRSEIISGAISPTKDSPVPTTPTRKRVPKDAKPRSGHRRSPSSKLFPLSSLIPDGIDDESDDELSIAGSFSSTVSRFHSPFSRTSANDNVGLPPLLSTPRKTTRKYAVLAGSPSSTRTPTRVLGFNRGGNMPPATDSRARRSQTRRRNRAVHSSPLARTVAERLLSSPTKRQRATPQRPPSLVASPRGTLRRCGEDGFVCERDFCLTCCK